MYAYPHCTEATDAEMGGDGTCDDGGDDSDNGTLYSRPGPWIAMNR